MSPLSRALFNRNHIADTLEHVLNRTKHRRFQDRFEGIPPQWAWQRDFGSLKSGASSRSTFCSGTD
jgi:hypothetical protein